MAKQDPNRDHGAPGLTIDTPTGDVPVELARLRKVPGKVCGLDLKIIVDAISLKRATVSYRTGAITDGAALTEICQDWLRTESARLSGKGGA